MPHGRRPVGVDVEDVIGEAPKPMRGLCPQGGFLLSRGDWTRQVDATGEDTAACMVGCGQAKEAQDSGRKRLAASETVRQYLSQPPHPFWQLGNENKSHHGFWTARECSSQPVCRTPVPTCRWIKYGGMPIQWNYSSVRKKTVATTTTWENLKIVMPRERSQTFFWIPFRTWEICGKL